MSQRGGKKVPNKVVVVVVAVSHFFPSFFHPLVSTSIESLQYNCDAKHREQRIFSWKFHFGFRTLFYILSLMKFEVKAIYLLWLRWHISLYEPPASTFGHICSTGIPPFFHCFSSLYLSRPPFVSIRWIIRIRCHFGLLSNFRYTLWKFSSSRTLLNSSADVENVVVMCYSVNVIIITSPEKFYVCQQLC